jgi:hypothetical protein
LIASDWSQIRTYDDLYGELATVHSDRALLMLGAAFLRRAWAWLPSESWRLAVEATEHFTSGRTTAADLIESWVNAEADTGEGPCANGGYGGCGVEGCPCCYPGGDMVTEVIDRWLRPSVARGLQDAAWFATRCSAEARRIVSEAGPVEEREERSGAEWRAQYELYRDIATAPPRLPSGAGWLRSSANVARLVRALDREEELGRLDMLALADALEEAGCAERALLEHCRAHGPHRRGCWAIEHLTGRAARPLPRR